jgi:hypothetical protein
VEDYVGKKCELSRYFLICGADGVPNSSAEERQDPSET